MTTAAAILFALVALGVVVSNSLCRRRPVGRVRDGRANPGTLPRAMRVSAVGQAALVAALAVYVLSAADLSCRDGTQVAADLVVVAFSALSLVLNVIRQARGSDGSGSGRDRDVLTSFIVALGA